MVSALQIGSSSNNNTYMTETIEKKEKKEKKENRVLKPKRKSPSKPAKRFRDLLGARTPQRREGPVDLDSVIEKVVLAKKQRVKHEGDKGGEEGGEGEDEGEGPSGDVLSRVRQRERLKAVKGETGQQAEREDAVAVRRGEVAQFVADVVEELAVGGGAALSERHVAQVAVDSSDGRVALAEAEEAVRGVVAQLVAGGRATRRRGVFRVLR